MPRTLERRLAGTRDGLFAARSPGIGALLSPLLGIVLAALLPAAPARGAEAVAADTASSARAGVQSGDCVVFREGGVGFLLTTPVYWLRGTVVEVAHERRLARLCPPIRKSLAAYSRADQLRLAAATPCVGNAAEVAEVNVLRVRVSIADWETPWSPQQGPPGWLYQGQFLDETLQKGKVIDMDASWLQRCEASS